MGQAGVMFRGSMDLGSVNVYLAFTNRSIDFQYRSGVDGNTTLVSTADDGVSRWVRLIRDGDTFSAYISRDGLYWNFLHTVDLPSISTTPLVCLASSSNNEDARSMAKYESVTVLPKPWVSLDIGNPMPGFSSFREGLFALTAAGEGIHGTQDGGHFVCQPLTGDGSISARVLEITNGNENAMAGVMFRATPEADSAQVFMSLIGNSTYQLQHREVDGGTTLIDTTEPATTPHYLRLVRQGSEYTAYTSVDEEVWTLVDSITLELGESPLACLATTSSELDSRVVALYQSVHVLPAPWTGTDIEEPRPGFGSFDGSQFILTSTGTGFTGTSDSGHLVCQPFEGDGSISANVASLEGGSGTHQAGVMFRESLAPDSKFTFMVIPSGGNAYSYFRLNDGGPVSNSASAGTLRPPQWVRLVKEGDIYTSYTSTNGIAWTPRYVREVSMTDTLLVCLASSSGSTALRKEAIFDSVTVLPYPWYDYGLGTTLPGYTRFLYDQYTVTAAGDGFTGTADEGELVCHEMSYDGSISARVMQMDSSVQAGVMFRQSFALGSAHSFLEVTGSQATLRSRASTNAAMQTIGSSGFSTPAWVRLVREDTLYTAFVSTDGLNWNTVASLTNNLGVTPYVCLATSSQDTDVTSPVIYESVSVVPTPWTMNALDVALPDYAMYDDIRVRGQYSVTASGSGFGSSSDSGSVVCHPFDFDGSISARVVTVDNTTSDAVGGVMVRESLSLGSTFAFTGINPTTGAVIQSRTSANGASSGSVVDAGVSSPYWVRVVRSGNAFSQFISTDSATWTQVGTQTITMNTIAEACLASTSGSMEENTLALYDGVSVLPAPWRASDVGNPLTGFSRVEGSQYVLTASGSGIGGTSDSGHFMCQQWTGDGTITARVVSINAGDTYKAGVMFRETMTDDSPFSYMYVPSSGYAYNQWRSTTASTASATRTNGRAPYWVRLVREGDQYTSYKSADGVTWNQVRVLTLSLGESPFVCLATTAGSASVKAESVFDNVSVVPSIL